MYILKILQAAKESRAALACLYRTSGRLYILELMSVDSRHFTQTVSSKDVGMLWHH